MDTKKYTTKVKMLWTILWAKQSTLVFQRHPGTNANSMAAGVGELRDLILIAAELKRCYEAHIEIINEAATHGGELHELLALRAALDVQLEQS